MTGGHSTQGVILPSNTVIEMVEMVEILDGRLGKR